MKLLHQITTNQNGKGYDKYSIIIPPGIIGFLNWLPGQELEAVFYLDEQNCVYGILIRRIRKKTK